MILYLCNLVAKSVRSPLLLIIGLLSFGSFAQTQHCTIQLSGVISDEENQPLAGATVVLFPGGTGTTTNSKGRFELGNLCEGTYQLEVRFVGFVTFRDNIKLNNSKALQISLQPEQTALQEVVIEDHAPRVEATSTFSTLSGHSLQEAMGKTLAEALRQLSGVNTIQTGPAIFKPVIHGLHSNRVLILNNGIRQEGQNWGAEHAPEVDPFIANNLVVIKDAAAIKYGSDALGGVVLVNPAELPREPGLGGQAHIVGATNNGSALVSGFLEGGSARLHGLGWRAQGTIKAAGDSRTPGYVLSNSGFREHNFSLATAYHKENSGIDVFFSHFNTTIGILPGAVSIGSLEDLANAMEREPPQPTNPFTYSIRAPRQEVQHSLAKVNAHRTSGKNDFRLQYGFQLNARREFDQRRGSLVDVPALGFRLFTHTLDLEWQRQHSQKFKSNWGVNLMHQVNEKIDGTQTIPFIPNFTHNALGIFVLEMWNLNRWTLEAGARADARHYDVAGFDFQNQLYRSELRFRNVSGTLSARYTASERSQFTTSLSSAWRPANLAELYSIGTHQSAASIEYGLLLDEANSKVMDYDQAGVQPERALKWVAGYNFTGSRLSLDVTGYFNLVRNFIYLQPRGVTTGLRGSLPYFRYTQTDASFAGVDGDIKYQFSRGWQANVRVAYLRATDTRNDDYLIFIPANRASASVRYESKSWNNVTWFSEVRISAIARQTRAPERVITPRDFLTALEQGTDLLAGNNRNFDFMAAPDGVVLVGAGVGVALRMKKTKLELDFRAENLTNQTYREFTNRLRYYANEVGQNFILGLHASF